MGTPFRGQGRGALRPRLVGSGIAVRRLCRQIIALGARQCTVLLQGESGTGKELVARLIHARSPRRDKPFVPVDSTNLRDTLFESQLFGHTRGAFTGADSSTLGFYRAADGGTLFLDEIGELPLQGQAKLLRCIQEGTITPLGSTRAVAADVRVVAATHRDLITMVHRGEFRQDLYYRLNVAKLRLPPLRERREDIPLLVQHASEDLAAVYREPLRAIASDAMQALVAHDWPGNVRELMNAIEHAFVFTAAGKTIHAIDLPPEVRGMSEANESGTGPGPMTLECAERQLIAAALQAHQGSQARVARALAIERHRLRRRIIHHGLTNLVRPQR